MVVGVLSITAHVCVRCRIGEGRRTAVERTRRVKYMNNSNQTAGHIAAFITILIWGTTYASTKLLLVDFAPLEILFFRFVMGYFCLLLIYPRRVKTANFREELLFISAGICGVTLYFLLENIALTYTLASNVGVIAAIAPFFTAILAHFFLDGEKLHPQFFLGFIVAIIGIILITFNGSFILKLNPVGDFLACCASVIWAFYSILMKKISRFGYNIVGVTRKVFFYGLLFMIPALFIMEFHWGLNRFANITNLFNLLFLGVGASALCFVSWNWAVGVLGAIKTSVYIYLVPVIAVAASAIVLHERITPVALFGTVLTLVGLLISEKNKKAFVRKH